MISIKAELLDKSGHVQCITEGFLLRLSCMPIVMRTVVAAYIDMTLKTTYFLESDFSLWPLLNKFKILRDMV